MRTLAKSLSILTLAACLTLSMGCTRQQWGTAGGAAVGGVAGNLVTGGSGVGTVVGAGAGALIGSQVYK
jgi:outer membrane lipoprotein SlyB